MENIYVARYMIELKYLSAKRCWEGACSNQGALLWALVSVAVRGAHVE